MAQAALNKPSTPAPAPDPAFHLDTNGETAPPPPPMVTIRLNRNYRPRGEYEVLGYWQKEIKVKSPAGIETIVQKREFVQKKDEDEGSKTFGKIKSAPAVLAGTGFDSKLWADTVIKVPKDEARHIRSNEIGTLEIDDD